MMCGFPQKSWRKLATKSWQVAARADAPGATVASVMDGSPVYNDPQALLERYLAITRAIAGQLDYQSVLIEIGGEVHSLFRHDHLDISIILPDRSDCCVAYEIGLATEWGAAPDEPKLIALSPIRELLSGHVDHILTGDAWQDERFHFEGAFDAPIFEANLRSRIHVPLYVHGAVIGSLNISRHAKNAYTEHDIAIARQLADLLAPYFHALAKADQAQKLALAEGAARGREEALRLGSLQLTEGMENERKRIGMDLHDQTLADLSRISRHVARLNRSSDVKSLDLGRLEAEISTCMTDLRRIIEDTKPSVMELFGFAQAVEAQLERSVAGMVPPVRTQVTDSASHHLDRCPDSLRITVFRIVQEAINNAVKHGPPSMITVSISAEDGILTVVVKDDGDGAEPEPGRAHGGLNNMRVRAALISASLMVSGDEPGGGTLVRITLPLQDRGERRLDKTTAKSSIGMNA